jgi:RecB family exonuclease
MSFMSASHSEIDTYNECERKHYYRYGKGLESKTDQDALVRGNVVHKVLSEYYLLRKLDASHEEAMEHAIPMLSTAMAEYNPFDPDDMMFKINNLLFWYFKCYADDTLKVLEVEVSYKAQLTDDFVLPVVIDLIAEIRGYGIGIIDHKVCYNFFNVDKLDMSPQLPRYMAASTALGIHVDFVMYNEIRHQNTKENAADPMTRFRRTQVPLTPDRVVNTMRDHLLAARRIDQFKAKGLVGWEGSILRNPSACQYCNMKDLCDADLNNRDAELTEQAFYIPRKHRRSTSV